VITRTTIQVAPGTLVTTAVASSDPAQAKVKRNERGISAPLFSTHRHLADDGRISCRPRRTRVPVAPCRRSTSDITVAASLPRGSPETLGPRRWRKPLGAPIGADTGVSREDLDRYLGTAAGHASSSTSIARSTAPPTIGGRDSNGDGGSSEKPPLAADYRKVNRRIRRYLLFVGTSAHVRDHRQRRRRRPA